MIVFTNNITARLRYILDFVGGHITGTQIQITEDPEYFNQFEGPKINYGNKSICESEFRIANSPLLFENTVHHQAVECFVATRPGGHVYKAFFATEGDFPFDIFAASFYLITRYEEYLPHQKDEYGRYSHKNSIAFKEGFLDLPLVNIWLQDFQESLKKKFPQLAVRGSSFTFIPTYDIDEAYAYANKQWWRTAGGLIKSVVSGRWSKLAERVSVLLKKEKDPYDAFEWMDKLNSSHGLRPLYFFLVAGSTAGYDKNILPTTTAMGELIRHHAVLYSIGIHPSWKSGGNANELRLEILCLGRLTGKPIRSSRQHYLRFTLPGTFRQLIDAGIESEFSMGYGTINGFRASVASPFYWYDLEREAETKLMIYPFCFMDANAFYEEKLSPEAAADELSHYFRIIKSVNGMLITIWHNNFLGTDKLFARWRDVYQDFLSSLEISASPAAEI